MADRYGYRDDERWRDRGDSDRDRDLRNRDLESRMSGRSQYDRDRSTMERSYGPGRNGRDEYGRDSYRSSSPDPTRRYGTAWNRDDDWWRNAEPRGMNHLDDDRGMRERDLDDRDTSNRMRQMGDRYRDDRDRMESWRDRNDRNDWHDYDRGRGTERSFYRSDRGEDRSPWDRDRSDRDGRYGGEIRYGFDGDRDRDDMLRDRYRGSGGEFRGRSDGSGGWDRGGNW